MNKNVIGWQSLHFDFEEDNDDNIQDESDSSFEEEFDDYNEINFAGETIRIPIAKRLLNTPLGIVDVSNKLNPFRHYEMWMMHTNFNLSQKVIDIISETPGIELVKPLSRYRCLIGLGRLFKFRDIRLNIENSLNANKLDIPDILKQKISEYEKYPHYTICMMPNGFIDAYGTDVIDNNFESILNSHVEAKKIHSSGIIHVNR